MAKLTQVLDDLYQYKTSLGNVGLGNDIIAFGEAMTDANATNADKVEAFLTLANSILAKASEGGILGNAYAVQTSAILFQKQVVDYSQERSIPNFADVIQSFGTFISVIGNGLGEASIVGKRIEVAGLIINVYGIAVSRAYDFGNSLDLYDWWQSVTQTDAKREAEIYATGLARSLDPTFTEATAKVFIDGSKSSDFGIGESVEYIKNIRKLLGLGTEFTATTANDVYEAVQTTRAAIQTLFGDSDFQISVSTNARTELPAFLSLYYLVPFSIKSTDAGAMDTLYNLHAIIADQWNADRNLTAEQIQNGEANFSDQYLADRAAMLGWVLKSNLDDTFGRADGLEAIYEDKESGINLSPIIASNTPKFIFGNIDSNAITGGNKTDHLYGMGGNDEINGGDGNDYLEGNAGQDTLNGEAGNDTLIGGTEVDILDGSTGNDDALNGQGGDDYLRCVIKLLSASLMRVCQPCPSDLKYASTSASKRIPVYTLGKAALGRPGLRLVSNSVATSLPTKFANTSAAGLNCFKSCNVTSRTSPAALVNGLWIFISRYLSFVSTTQTNHSNTASNRRKTQHMQALIEIAKSHQSLLRISVTAIYSNTCRLPIKIDHTIKRQLTLSLVFYRLSCIECYNHINYCIYNNCVCQTSTLSLKKCKWIQAAANDNKWRVPA